MDDSRMAKIEALLKKAESTKFAEEAETYYAKASELMAKWSIDEAMLREARKGENRGTPVHRTITLNKSGLWRSNLTLIGCLCRPNDVKLVYIEPRGKGSKPVVHLIGFDEDVRTVEMLYASMLIQNTRMRRQMMPPEYTTQTQKVPWLRSFINGFAIRIEDRLTEAKRAATVAGEAQYGSSLLPVLASKAAVVQTEMEKIFPFTKPAKASRSRTDYNGWDAGKAAADKADIGNKRIGDRKAIGS